MSEASVGVIRNPESGRGRGAKAWPPIESRLRACLGSRLVRIEQTIEPGSGRRQAERMAGEGIEIVVAAGGDGTVSDVCQGLLGTGSALGIIPLGTGNDFARTIGVGPHPNQAIEALSVSRNQRVDVGRWRQGDREGFFLNIAGCGFDAAVAHRINHAYRQVRGTLAYVLAVIETLRSYRATDLTLDLDGEPLNERAMLCAMANATYYGGGMKVAPTAQISDGRLNLVLVRDMPRLRFLLSFPRVFKGTHLSHPKVMHRTFKRVSLTSTPEVPFLVDGEVLPAQATTVEVVPLALDVVVGSPYP